MCLATPVKIIRLQDNKATVDALGKKNQVDTSLLKGVRIGDYLYASQGLAIKKVSRRDAEKVLELVRKWAK
jgi:hydrogenase expression/formation protein HypC